MKGLSFPIQGKLTTRRPTVLIVGAGFLQKPTFEAAKTLGLQTIVTDRDPNAPSVPYANAWVNLDTMDAKRHALLVKELASHLNLVGVFTQGTDVEITVAQAAKATGLPGVNPDAAFRCKNKVAFRKTLKKAGIIQPPFQEITTLKEAKNFIQAHGLPVIVKAIDNSASRGATKIETRQDLKGLKESIAYARSCSSTHTSMIETCLHGPEQSIETFVWGRKQHRLNIVDRPFAFDPFPIELGHDNPTRLPQHMQQKLYRMVEDATKALGITFGAAKADTMISQEYGPVILEMTARLSGGYHSQATSPAAYGTREILAALEVSTGKPLDEKKIKKRWHKVSLCRSLFPPPGKIVAFRGLREARKIPGVWAIYLVRKVGDIIPSYRTCIDRPCYIITVSRTHEGAQNVLRRVEQTFRIITKPL